MKNTLIIVTFLFWLPLTAQAYNHEDYWRSRTLAYAPPVHTPAPAPQPPSPPAPVSTPIVGGDCPANLGMNYGHDTQTYDLSKGGQVDQDIAVFKACGIRWVRLAYNGFNNPQSEALALHFLANGINPILGGDWGTLNSSQLVTYDQEVLEEAQWAQANGIPELGVGNEEELRLNGITIAQWAQNLVTLSNQVRAVYSGHVSYSLDADYLSQYEAAVPKGTPLILGLNSYDDPQGLQAQIQSAIATWGASNVEVTEWNCDIPNVPQCQTDSGLANYVAQDLSFLKTMGVPYYFFTYRAGATAPAYWGVVSDPLTLKTIGIN